MEGCFLRHLPEPGDLSKALPEPNAHIIVIPGVDDKPVKEWSKAYNVPLVCDLVERSTPALRIQVSVLEHQLTSTTFKHWGQLDRQAQLLLDKVEGFVRTWNSERRPLLFLCHSLGGIVLKRLLVHARRKDADVKPLLDSLAGVVFLGTPHLRESNISEWTSLYAILQLSMLAVPVDLTDASKLRLLAQWSRDFENLDLPFCLLTTREGKKSKKKTKRWKEWGSAFSGESLYIVGTASLASTSLPDEKVVLVNTDHHGLCTLNEHEGFRDELIEFCHHTLRKGRDARAPKMTKDGRQSPSNLTTLTLRPKVLHRSSVGSAGASIHPDPEVSSAKVHSTQMPSTPFTGTAIAQSNKTPTTTATQYHPMRKWKPQIIKNSAQAYLQKAMPDTSNSTSTPVVQPVFETSTRYKLKLRPLMVDESVAVTNFYGRIDVLTEIDEHLLVRDGQQAIPKLRTVALIGMGGIGKTSIAHQYIWSRRTNFDVVLWLNAETVPKLYNDFRKIAVGLCLQRPEEEDDPVRSKHLVMQWLQNPLINGHQNAASTIKSRWLLVFDNVDDIGAMQEFWPPSGTGSILLTSRRRYVGTLASYSGTNHHDRAHSISVQPFSDLESEDFLFRATHRVRTYDDEQAVRKVNRYIHGYPLFLAQLAAVVVETCTTFSEILEMMVCSSLSEILEMYKTYNEGFHCPRQYGSTSTIEYMIWELRPEARMLLKVMSFLDLDCIQEGLLTGAAAMVKAEDYPKTQRGYLAARNELWEYSLIQRCEDRSRKIADNGPRSKDASERGLQSGRHHGLIGEGSNLGQEVSKRTNERNRHHLSVHRILQTVVRSLMTIEEQLEVSEAAISLLLTRWD